MNRRPTILYVGKLHHCFFFFNDTATTEIYTLSLHDALPIFRFRREMRQPGQPAMRFLAGRALSAQVLSQQDRKSTRLNSSHSQISYAVFCLKKKKPYFILDRSMR